MTRVINIDDLTLADRNLLFANHLDGYVYIGRHNKIRTMGKWGNRYSHLSSSIMGTIRVPSRDEAIARHRHETLSDPKRCEEIRRELKDKTLVCWCKPLACHGDTYAEIADAEEWAA